MKKLVFVFLFIFLSFSAFADINKDLLKKAYAGDMNAILNVAKYYYHNEGNYTKAYEYYLKAANNGNEYAQNYIGWMYQNGLGVERDYKKAMDWYEKSAKQENSYAQNCIGWMYQRGLGVKADYKKAMDWYEKSAKQENSYAQNNIGYLYEYGLGVSVNYKTARDWYLKAAYQNYNLSQNYLGLMYLDGKLTSKPDVITGCAWIYIGNVAKEVARCDLLLNDLSDKDKRKLINTQTELESKIIKN